VSELDIFVALMVQSDRDGSQGRDWSPTGRRGQSRERHNS